MIELKAQPRTLLGSQVKTLRKKGLLPCVVYGEGVTSQPLATSFIDFERVLKQAGESTLVTLDIAGKKHNVLIHDIAYDALKGNPIHADFYAVAMDKVINATVSLEFVGESSAIKSDGGILVKVMHEIEVEALPQDLPHELRIDLGLLSTFESKILVKDISLPKGVTVTADLDEIIALVEAPRSAEDLAAL
ncbi:MAG: 50S ribosomal protein L25, partial [Candidatus Sungbacteria bacterium]|nr:50S ribosomal protein L25 [Candidatus Sungbacteria bacterium]